MALVKCSECGKDISDSAEMCPHCGAPQDPSTRAVKCPDCGTMVSGGITSCPKCGRPISRETVAGNFTSSVTGVLNKMAGVSVKSKITFNDLFKDIFKKHSTEDMEDVLTRGTKFNRVDVKTVNTSSASTWAWSRVLVLFLCLIALFSIGFLAVKVTTFAPGFFFACAFAVPVTMVIFFHELNILHNITLHKTLLHFFIGGAIAMLITIFESQVILKGMSTNDIVWRFLLVSLTEEVAKALTIAGIFTLNKKAATILDGILIGCSVGAGFAAFETMGYLSGAISMDQLQSMAFQRAILALGMHLAWGALEGAGIMMAKGFKKKFSWGNLASLQFFVAFLIPFLIHWVWDVIAFNGGSQDDWVPYLLTLLIWIPLGYCINVGLAQAMEAKAYYANLATVTAANKAEKTVDEKAKKPAKSAKK